MGSLSHNDKRLSKDDIESMMKDAERFQAEDDVQRAGIAAENLLQDDTLNVKSALTWLGSDVKSTVTN